MLRQITLSRPIDSAIGNAPISVCSVLLKAFKLRNICNLGIINILSIQNHVHLPKNNLKLYKRCYYIANPCFLFDTKPNCRSDILDVFIKCALNGRGSCLLKIFGITPYGENIR